MEKRKGFTLIELLVVISIIALLLAILMPSLNRVRNNAKAVVCQNNLKQWGTVLAMHVEDNQGFLFYKIYKLPNNVKYYSTIDLKYFNEAQAKSKIRFCPMAVRKGNRPLPERNEMIKWLEGLSGSSTTYPISSSNPGTCGSTFESWVWENEDSNSLWTGSYGLNSAFAPHFMDNIKLAWDDHVAYTEKKQSNIPVYLDSALPYSIFLRDDQKPPSLEDQTSCVINRHDGGVNSLFLDWSVRKVGLKELWKLKWHKEFNTNGPWTIAGGVKPEDWPPWMRGFKDY